MASAASKLILLLLVVLTVLVQTTQGLFPTVFGVSFMLLVPLVVCIGACFGETQGFVYGLLGGVLLDCASSSPDGVNALFFALAGCISGLLVSYVFRRTLPVIMIINTVICIIYSLLRWFMYVYLSVGSAGLTLLWSHYLASAVITAVFAPVTYLILRLCRQAYDSSRGENA